MIVDKPSPLVYLTTPVSMDDAVRLARHRARAALEITGATVYDPTAAWAGYATDVSRTTEANMEVLSKCDGLLAVCLADIFSASIPMEVARACESGLPTVYLSITPIEAFDRLGAQWCNYTQGWDHAVWVLMQQISDDEVTKKVGRRRELKFAGEGELPTAVYSDDAGYDIFVSSDCSVLVDGMTDVPHNIHVELPKGVWGLILGRSSTIRTRGLIVVPAVVDTGYRGDLRAAVYNISGKVVYLHADERIAQLILMPNLTSLYEPTRVDELSMTERSTRGFGSSGV